MCSELFNKFVCSQFCQSPFNIQELTTRTTSKVTSSSNSLNFEPKETDDWNESLEEEDDEEDDEDNAMFEDLTTRCECGIELSIGWQCENCRVNCPECNRALTKDPEDYCTRCNTKCQMHGLYKLSAYKVCPQC